MIEAAFRLVLVERAAREPLQEAILLISVCLFLVFFAWLRNRVQAWLTSVVFRQGSVGDSAGALARLPAVRRRRSVPGVGRLPSWPLPRERQAISPSSARRRSTGAEALHAPVPSAPADAARRWDWAEAVVPMRLARAAPG